MTREDKNIKPIGGYRYVCLKDCKDGRFTCGKTYYCDTFAGLKDNDNNGWSFDDEPFNEYFIEEKLLWKIVKNIPFELIMKIKLEDILLK